MAMKGTVYQSIPRTDVLRFGYRKAFRTDEAYQTIGRGLPERNPVLIR